MKGLPSMWGVGLAGFEFGAVDLAGIAALTASLIWPLFRGRRTILAAQVVSNSLWTLHYVLLGVPTAAALCAVVIVQALSAFPERRGVLVRGLYVATLPAILLVAGLSWNGLTSALSALGLLSSTIGRWQTDMVRFRAWYLVAGVFWFTHNLLVVSPYGLTADLFAFFNNWRRMREAVRARGTAALPVPATPAVQA